MKIKTYGKFSGEVTVPASKSHMHRLIICASLCEKKTIIKNITLSEDILATLGAIKSLGGDFEIQQDKIIIMPINNLNKKAKIDCCESGSTMRFLLPLVSALGANGTFVGKGKLPNRPISPLDGEMCKKGITFTMPKEDGLVMPFSVSGKLKSGEYKLSGNVSSQFISGLLFSLPLLDGDSEIILTSPLQSRAYVDITINTLKTFNIEITETENSYKIKGNQKYVSPKEVFAEGDWSNGAFFLCGGVLSGDLKINGLSFSSSQGDKEIYNILKKMGANLTHKDGTIYAKKSKLCGIDVDVSQIPDLVPVLAVTMALSKGKSLIYNASRLRIKESDRLKSTTEGILKLGGDIKENDDSLEITGKEKLGGGEINSFNDHRIAMAMAIASLRCEKEVTINEPMCVKKSYPNFYEDFEKAGGIKNVINMG